MTYKNHRSLDRGDVCGDRGGVESETAQRVRWGDHRMTRVLQLTDHSAEARRIGEGAVNQDDGGCR
jgi:hypothetical protein